MISYPYLYEAHCHTSQGSRCGASTGAEMARHFHKAGYTGLFITDHFFNGNCAAPSDAPWDERVRILCSGYDDAKQEGDKLGLDVFLGWEYSYGWCHLLTYNLGKDWLLAHPDVLEWDVITYLNRVHEDGGFIVHAHPFRERVDLVSLMPYHVDAIETLNGCREDEFNRYADGYAKLFQLPSTAGSDYHSHKRSRLCGVAVERKFETSVDYLTAIRSGRMHLFDREFTEE